ncbi:DUF6463 family protein [Glycomyces xiaoerkulensis]|uniref:DUF6463 family protein n=1 Tax=Glycomyces xiaoerkulensis TaxID=2038139 RepID=UPI0018E41B9C|nr:DUF6463 family protein [Glycomyces xiaoerkulensis]
MTTTSEPDRAPVATGAARLTIIAGWSLIVVAVLHTAVFVPQAPWRDWFSGSLRSVDPDAESVAVFWALPGGIVVPALLLGLLMIRLGRQHQRVGLGYALAILAWVSFCLWLVGPSGFLLLLVTVGLLVAAAAVDRRAS